MLGQELIPIEETNPRKRRLMAKRTTQERSVQVSMSPYSKQLLKMLAIITGTTMAGIINKLIEPHINFMKLVLKKKGLMDEYDNFLIDEEKIVKILEEDKRNPHYVQMMQDYTTKTDVEFPYYDAVNMHNF